MFTTVFEPSFVSTDEQQHSAINSFVYNIISPYYINGAAILFKIYVHINY